MEGWNVCGLSISTCHIYVCHTVDVSLSAQSGITKRHTQWNGQNSEFWVKWYRLDGHFSSFLIGGLTIWKFAIRCSQRHTAYLLKCNYHVVWCNGISH